jgi:PAS domain S-box-containing protein
MTKHQQVEQQLRLLKSTVCNINEGVVITESNAINPLEPQIVYVNEAFIRMTGYTYEDVLGKTPRILQGPKTNRTELDKIRCALEMGQPVAAELINYRKDGSEFEVALSLVPVANEKGYHTHWIALQRDITERKRSEQRLQAQYTTARTLAESATLEEATPKILQAICDSLGWDVGELWSINPQTNALDCVKIWCQPSVKIPEFEAATRKITFSRGIGLPGRVWESGQPLWIADVVQDSNFLRATVAEREGLHGAFGFPILNSKGVLGVLTFLSRDNRPLDTPLLEMVIAIGQQIGQFIERKQAEAALEQQRQWLEVTLSSIGDAVITTDTNAVITFMNPVAEALTGWSQAQALGQTIDTVFQIIDQYSRTPAEIPVRRVLKEKITVELIDNTLLITRNGRELPIDDSCAPIRDQDGKLQGVVLIFRDITKRNQAAAALQKSEKQHRSVINNVKDVIFQTDAAGLWTFLNPAWTEITGFSVEGSLGTNILNYIHPDDHSVNIEQFQPLLKSEKESCQHEIRYLTQEGSIRWLEVFARLTLDDHGRLIGTSGTLHDITERKQAEAEIRKALEKERELGELKSRFVSMTSHEFRTPLTTILSSAELIEHYSNQWTPEKKLSHLQRIQINVKHLTRLLDDILLIGKADAGRIEFNPAPLNLIQFCCNLAEEFQWTHSNQTKIIFVSPEEYINAFMDEKLLRHILGNLLSNAIKYSPQGSPVYLELNCINQEAIFRIQDQGIGIPDEDQERLFELFHRATNVGKIPGTGLGLAIVKKSVDLHGGEITVSSQVGVGTTFAVSLPCWGGMRG